MSDDHSYRHTQQAPLCLILYGISLLFAVLAVALRHEPVLPWLFFIASVVVLILATSFHSLTVTDHGERLSVSFGPLPLFRRNVAYNNLVNVQAGRTTLLDGWGIHISLNGGWVWNIWGRDCVVLTLKNGTLRIGTDDQDALADFLRSRLTESRRGQSDAT